MEQVQKQAQTKRIFLEASNSFYRNLFLFSCSFKKREIQLKGGIENNAT